MLDKITKILLPIFLGAVLIIVIIRLFFSIIPVFLGYIFSLPLVYLSNQLFNKFKINRTLSRSILVLLTVAIIGSLFSVIVYRLSMILPDLIANVPQILENLSKSGDIIKNEQVREWTQKIFEYGLSNLSDLGKTAVSSLLPIASSIPNFLIKSLFFILSLFFFTKDYEKIRDFAQRIISKYAGFLVNTKKSILSTLKKYFKAQFILMGITYCISLVGLGFKGVALFPLVALAVAIIDVLPLLGPAVFYSPIILYSFITGDTNSAIYFFILYLITTITRQVLEPKLVSDQIGIHPLFTISTILVCYSFVGGKGLLLGIFLVLVASVSLSVYKLYKSISRSL